MSLARLRKACKNCKPSSIQTYWYNIRTLARLAGKDDVPAKGSWLNDALRKRVGEMPLQRRKRYAAAAVKASQMYGTKSEKWVLLMSKASEQYARQRETGKRTKREHENWPKDGYKALRKLADTMHGEVKFLESKDAWSRSDLYHYQKYLIVRFYSTHALRGDLADVRLKRPLGSNWYDAKKHTLHIGEHKTAKARGALTIELTDASVRRAFDVFVPHAKKRKHGFLLSTLRTDNRLNRHDMLKLIRNLTKDRLGKNIGVQLIRVLKVSAHQKEIDKATDLQRELGHSGAMQRRYISRD